MSMGRADVGEPGPRPDLDISALVRQFRLNASYRGRLVKRERPGDHVVVEFDGLFAASESKYLNMVPERRLFPVYVVEAADARDVGDGVQYDVYSRRSCCLSVVSRVPGPDHTARHGLASWNLKRLLEKFDLTQTLDGVVAQVCPSTRNSDGIVRINFYGQKLPFESEFTVIDDFDRDFPISFCSAAMRNTGKHVALDVYGRGPCVLSVLRPVVAKKHEPGWRDNYLRMIADFQGLDDTEG